jgi:solute carrier family 25 oxoglutarate transporter 11
MNFLIGGISGCTGTFVIQPIDYLKVQIQVRSEQGGKSLNPFQIAKEIYSKNKSVLPFYKGLDSALLRQVLYTSTRLGLFYTLTDNYKKKHNRNPPIFMNVALSLTAGAIGSFVGNPADLALVRMQTDISLPENEKRNYKNVFDALIRTVREEGVLTLWRGSTPTVVRAMSMNFSLLVPFEETKKLLKNLILNEKLRSISASLVAGGCAAILSLPFDNIKTKLQKMKKNAQGELPYKGVTDCLLKSVKKEGASRLWVGLSTYYFRVAPHAIISLVCNDFLRGLLTKKKV